MGFWREVVFVCLGNTPGRGGQGNMEYQGSKLGLPRSSALPIIPLSDPSIFIFKRFCYKQSDNYFNAVS